MSHPETDPSGVDGTAAEQPPTPIEPAPQAGPATEGGPAVPPASGAATHGLSNSHGHDRTRPKAAAAAAASAAASMGMTTPVQRMTRSPQNYAAAVYGSVFAASVVISAGDLREPVTLAVLLISSGLVFWIAHV